MKPAPNLGGNMYINPSLLSVYETDYLLLALSKSSIPRWLKTKIAEELARRGVLRQPTAPANVIEPEVKYHSEKIDGELYLCFNQYDHYFSLTPCKSNRSD